MSSLDAIFKAYDVRGIVPDELDAEVCRRIGAAFASFTEAPSILVARDMRGSGEELSQAFADGVMSEGADVVHLGLASTDLLYFAAGRLDSPGAMFTASHNPSKYNGVKLCLAGARPVGQDTGLARIKELVEVPAPATGRTPGTAKQLDLMGEYAEHVRSFVDIGALRPLRVVADTGNGMGGLVAPRVFEGLPYELELLYPELDGSFPNHPPDPIQPENLKDLQARILDTGADVGLAFDGDADRVFLVDEKAEPVPGSTTTSMVAKAMLEKYPGATIIHNLICSKAVPEVIRENGGTPVRTRVGHSFIKAVMADTDAVFGGEHSGHYYFRDNYRADSGLIAAVVVLELLGRTGRPLSETRRPFERYAMSGELNSKVDGDPIEVMEQVAELHADASIDRTDGLTVDHGDWWFNLRPSNTESLLRLNLEAATREQCDAHVNDLLALIRGESGRA
jgi:phosphomannomutase